MWKSTVSVLFATRKNLTFLSSVRFRFYFYRMLQFQVLLLQIDNALLFKDMGGLPWLIKAINYTKDERIQKEAALALGAATQR